VVPSDYFSAADTAKKKPGPVKNIGDDELFRYRDWLVQWLEEIWPEVAKALLSTKDPRGVRAIFKDVAQPKHLQPPWQTRLLAHSAHLLDFRWSNKFRIKPPKKTVLDALRGQSNDEKRKRAANRLPTRQIANAMAGLPWLQWRTSLDRCAKEPSHLKVAAQSERYYREMFGIAGPEDQSIAR
jgi:hypothetical protein